MESVLSNVPGCKLHTWARVVSTTHASLEIQEQQFFGTFQKSCFNNIARPFFTCFRKTPRFSCSIWFPSFLHTIPFTFALKVNLTFGLNLTVDIPEGIQNPSQRTKMELFEKMVNDFPSIIIFTKSSILDV